jgi:hypothetical protein
MRGCCVASHACKTTNLELCIAVNQKALGSFLRGDVQTTAETTQTVDQSQSDSEPADNVDDVDETNSESTSTSNCSCPCCTKPKSSHRPIEVSDLKYPLRIKTRNEKLDREKHTQDRFSQANIHGFLQYLFCLPWG